MIKTNRYDELTGLFPRKSSKFQTITSPICPLNNFIDALPMPRFVEGEIGTDFTRGS
jgi:hypothetical protein